MTTPAIALLLKVPVEGEVKTRLAHSVGVAEATRIYRRLVEYQLAQLPPEWPARIHFTPPRDENLMRNWLGPRYTYSAQVGGDLGHRLTAALRAHFAGGTSPVILLGGDCPYLGTERLREAADLLAGHDAVVIPALDGGYCLLGLRRPEEHVFTAISWSSSTVMDETRQRLRDRGLTWAELPALEDVDDEASWERAKSALPNLASAIP